MSTYVVPTYVSLVYLIQGLIDIGIRNAKEEWAKVRLLIQFILNHSKLVTSTNYLPGFYFVLREFSIYHVSSYRAPSIWYIFQYWKGNALCVNRMLPDLDMDCWGQVLKICSRQSREVVRMFILRSWYMFKQDVFEPLCQGHRLGMKLHSPL
ncbi:hypothetical protein LIER_15535 [Lithospermum erythrorhizon]|uniref:Maturase K n=1 Tax=Lithospermum erythrorhizon TaxID=34254 RepID=A0AAV3Q5W1_LITER